MPTPVAAGNVSRVCLLIAVSGLLADAPLIVAANRDERYARPAVTMTILRESGPRILGGRDELAGGTWLAVNEHGLVAGLTNQWSPQGRDPDKKSRGELPLAFAAYRDARSAIEAVCPSLDPAAYNPCCLLVGDRQALFSVDLTGEGRPQVEDLAPGSHVLENSPLRARSAKQLQVAARLSALTGRAGRASAAGTAAALADVLRDHRPAIDPAAASPAASQPGTPARPAALLAACVHTAEYGTRSAVIVTVPAAGPPRLQVADGPPCQVPLRDMTTLWAAA
ncbi:MAG: NRDE family protein [Streptosporangiaceae bacterium]